MSNNEKVPAGVRIPGDVASRAKVADVDDSTVIPTASHARTAGGAS